MSASTMKLAIVSSLGELMQDRPLSEITVTDICQKSGIARSTFYRHFRDVPNVVSWLWDQANIKGIYQEGKTLSCHAAHLRTFEELRRHRDFFSSAFRTVDYSSLVQYGGTVMLRYLRDIYEAKSGNKLSESESLLLEFFATGAKHMTRHWAVRGMKEDPSAMANAFMLSMPSFVLPYLEPDPTCKVEVVLEL